jgi:hypothetical protein
MTGDREEVRIAEAGRIACSAATREEVAAHRMAGAAGEAETAVTAGIVGVAEAAKMATRAPEGRCRPLATTIKISSQRRRC